MATEKGIVIKADSNTALVKTTRSSSCESCDSRKSCSVISDGKEMEMEVEVINDANAKAGDRVVLSFETSALLKASFLLYVFPIILLLTGALLGQYLASFFNLNPQTAAAILGFFFFFLAFGFIRFRGNKMAEKKEYRPKIIRILQ